MSDEANLLMQEDKEQSHKYRFRLRYQPLRLRAAPAAMHFPPSGQAIDGEGSEGSSKYSSLRDFVIVLFFVLLLQELALLFFAIAASIRLCAALTGHLRVYQFHSLQRS